MIVVIGGGPAGIMAAIKASESSPVILLEKNERLGKKLFITGKGRCNLCNDCNDSFFFDALNRNASFMYSSYYTFSSSALKAFFELWKIPLKVERGQRVFPKSDKSSDIIKGLMQALNANKVDIRLNTEVLAVKEVGGGFLVETKNESLTCKKLIIATGGITYSATGSTGDGYKWAKELGIRINKPIAGLVGMRLKRSALDQLHGLSLKNVVLQASSGEKSYHEFGEMLFTHYGISGPIVLSLSSKINRLNNVSLSIDLKPALSFEQLEKRILREIEANPNREIQTLLKTMMPKALIGPILKQTSLEPHLPSHQLSRVMREQLIRSLKHFSLEYDGLFDVDTGIITTGGIAIEEIDPSSMQSRSIPGLYFCGEIIDVDGPTGGFNLQIAFSTGYLAGLSAREEVL